MHPWWDSRKIIYKWTRRWFPKNKKERRHEWDDESMHDIGEAGGISDCIMHFKNYLHLVFSLTLHMFLLIKNSAAGNHHWQPGLQDILPRPLNVLFYNMGQDNPTEPLTMPRSKNNIFMLPNLILNEYIGQHSHVTCFRRNDIKLFRIFQSCLNAIWNTMSFTTCYSIQYKIIWIKPCKKK